MVNFRIIYGYAITIYDIEKIFNYDKYPDFWENDGRNIKNEVEVFELAKAEIVKITKHRMIKIIMTDLEFSFSNKDDSGWQGESTLLIGIELGECKAHNVKSTILPEVSDDVKDIMKNYLNTD